MAPPASPLPSFWQAFRFWLKMGFISFGGPAGQISILHEELVERRRWISEERFLHALNYCMLLPGPEAQQLCIYIGWLLHRTWGGIVAGALFVLPSLFLLLGLSAAYLVYGPLPAVAGLLYGLKAAVLALVLSALIRIGRKALKNHMMWLIAFLAFGGICFLKLPFPLLILGAGLWGLAAPRWWPDLFPKSNFAAEDSLSAEHHTRSSWGRLGKIGGLGLLLWAAPLVLFYLVWGPVHVFTQEAFFFSKAALVTFGGAYAVLPYIAQAGVSTYHWLSASQMMDGLGLAETTPGPLIMVVTFIGFVGAFQHSAAGWSPFASALWGGCIATYFTFLPCFLWIFLGAPYIEKTRKNPFLSSALSCITAAVVGVILNLSVFFAGHFLFRKTGFDIMAACLSILAFAALQYLRWNVLGVVAAGAALGFLTQHLGWIRG